MKKTTYPIIICCIALVIGLISVSLLFSKKQLTKNKNLLETNTTVTVKETTLKEFEIGAFRFGYNPDSIKVKKGDRVKITINNSDTLHGIRIPELGLAGNDDLEFTAEKSGQFTWYCNNFCGEDHRQMQGTLIVE